MLAMNSAQQGAVALWCIFAPIIAYFWGRYTGSGRRHL
jgi:hypothetical protein